MVIPCATQLIFLFHTNIQDGCFSSTFWRRSRQLKFVSRSTIWRFPSPSFCALLFLNRWNNLLLNNEVFTSSLGLRAALVTVVCPLRRNYLPCSLWLAQEKIISKYWDSQGEPVLLTSWISLLIMVYHHIDMITSNTVQLSGNLHPQLNSPWRR